jgi:hypothetical protein
VWHQCYKGAALLNLISLLIPRFSFHFVTLITLTSLLILSAATAQGQGNQPSGRELLPDVLGNLWRADGAPKQLTAEQFRVVEDAEVYLEYGLQSVMTRAYLKGRDRMLIEVFEMRYPSGAYGLFTFNRGSLSAGQQEFQAGRYLVRVSGITETTAVDETLINSIRERLAGDQGEFSPLPGHLPEPGRISRTEKYLAGPTALAALKPFADLEGVINFTGGAEAVTAQYQNGDGQMSLIIIDYYTPQLAADNYARLKKYIESLSAEEKSRRLIKRPGNYVVQAVNVRDRKTAHAIVDQIKYAPRVYWEGDRFNSIPYEFRPPDPLALEEARRTGAFLLTTFYIIGLMITGSVLLGVIAGGSFFYWRRYRRRQLGFENAFSDAGGTIRLNLDDFLLGAADESQVKLLEKRDWDKGKQT